MVAALTVVLPMIFILMLNINIFFLLISDLPDDEIDMVYAERNVLHEEATTVEAETITVDRFRQRFCNTTEKGQQKFSENTNNITISSNTNLNTNSDQSQQNQQQPKYKAPPPPPRQRRTSSSSTIIKVSLLI